MANSPNQTPTSNRVITVSSLLSPPEMKRTESFGSSIALTFDRTPSQSFDSQPPQVSYQDTLDAQPHIMAYSKFTPSTGAAYVSPPISPYDTQAQKENMDGDEEQGTRDPQLFATGTGPSPIASDEPLFPRESQESKGSASQDAITEHMNSAHYADLKTKPSREEYELLLSAVELQSTAIQNATMHPRAWRERERQYERHYGQSAGVQKPQPLKKLAPAPSSKARHQKVAIPRINGATPRPVRAAPKPRRTPQSQALHSFDWSPASASPKPARPSTAREDTDFNALPDYCPPLDTLPKGNTKSLKAEWKGGALDLSEDSHRGMLHEAEINLASTLRLNCATYLCSKRRIFQARIEALKIGKEFRKTDAQQACKIDVNKASKLWQSFDKVGWFDPAYFRQYLSASA